MSFLAAMALGLTVLATICTNKDRANKQSQMEDNVVKKVLKKLSKD